MTRRRRFLTPVLLCATAAVLALSGTYAGAAAAPAAGVASPAPSPTGASPTPPPSPSPSASPTGTPSPSASPTASASSSPSPSPSPTSTTCTDPGPQPGQPGPASSDPAVPPNPGSAVDEAMKNVGGEIINLWVANGYPGFAGVIANEPASVLDLYWLPGQPLPPAIAAIVANPGYPITVVQVSAPYGRGTLTTDAQNLANDTSVDGQMCGFLNTIEILEDGTGLGAVVEPYNSASFSIPLAQALLTAAAGVPVTVTVGPQVTDLARLNDTAPWWGGAGLTSPGQGFCSSAFGVVNNATGAQYMLTANHCYPNGANVSNGNGTAVLGPVALNRPLFDSELISVGANAGTFTFFGGVNGVGVPEYTQQVRVAAANVRGTSACTSGASTGENCALNIAFTNVIILQRVIILGLPVLLPVRFNMVIADSTVVRANGQLAVAGGQGDSGGPVVTDDSGNRRALGTISAGRNLVGCGLFAAPGKLCFSTVVYADLNTLLTSYGVAMR